MQLDDPNAHAGAPLLLLGQVINTMRAKGVLDDEQVAIWRIQFGIAERDHPQLSATAKLCNTILDEAIRAHP